MLSFTKYPPASQTTLASDHEFLSLTQDSYMPLPEKKSHHNSTHHVSQDSTNQFRQSATRDLNSVRGDQSLNANLSRGSWFDQSQDASPSKNNRMNKESLKSVSLSLEDQISDIPTLSHTRTTASKQHINNTKSPTSAAVGGGENTSDIQTLSYTISGKGAASNGGKTSNSNNDGGHSGGAIELTHLQQQQQHQHHFIDSSIRTLSHTITTSEELVKRQQEKITNVDDNNIKTQHGLSPRTNTKMRPENDRKSPIRQLRETTLDDNLSPRTKVKSIPDSHWKSRETLLGKDEDAWKRAQDPASHDTPSTSTTLATSKERNTLSLLTSDRTLSELANLRLTSSAPSSPNKSISRIAVPGGAENLDHEKLNGLFLEDSDHHHYFHQRKLDEQDLSDSSVVTKDTLDLISQLLSSNSLQHHQPSDTESSELFTVGRLSLSRLEQSRLLGNMDDDIQAEVQEVRMTGESKF